MDDKALRNLSYGLFVLTAKEGDKDNGCIINTVTQVANTPDRISIAVNKNNYTHDMILATGEFNVSILSQDTPFDTFKHFGFQSGRDVDKTVGINFSRSENGLIYITDTANAYLSGKVIQTVDVGSHTMFIADLVDGAVLSDKESVTYAYYFSNIKPAPGETEKKKGWVCKICGYIYEGDELPEDFICPICKHPASDFERLK
ncbi:MAG: flavin reductase [Firmicutes bacterium]|nr:flavin reductase [Bacillota bacterium]